MRSQKVCLLASPVTRRRWALRLYNAYTSQAKSASNSFPIFCSALPTSMWKISPAFCWKLQEKASVFRQSRATRSLEGRGRLYLPSKGASNSTRSFIALVPTSLLKISAAFCLKTIRKREGFRQSRPPKEEGRKRIYLPSQSRLKPHRILYSIPLNMPVEDQRGSILQTIGGWAKGRATGDSSPPRTYPADNGENNTYRGPFKKVEDTLEVNDS